MAVLRLMLGAVLGVFLMLLGLVLEGGHVSSILQLTAFVIVLGPTAGFLVMSFPFRTHATAFRAALGKERQEPKALVLAQHYFTTMSQGFVVFGFVGVTLGLIHVMENLDKPDRIGPGIAVAFVSMLYGFLFRISSGALYDAASEKLTEQTVTPVPGTQATPVATHDVTADVAALRARVGELARELEQQKNDRRAA